jgi:putative membrane protein
VRYTIANSIASAVVVFGIVAVSAQSQPGRPPQPVNPPVAQVDEQFVKDAAMSGMAEVDLGTLATEKSTHDGLKTFAQRMVHDHGSAGEELRSLAAAKQITLDRTLDSKHQAAHDRLAILFGAAFDRAYVSDMVKDHREAVEAFRREADGGHDIDIKSWAKKTLPILQEHLKQVEDLQSDMAAGVTTTIGLNR